jgi:hypothetical protein
MAAPPEKPNVTREQRRALELLASIPHGISEDLLALADGFNRHSVNPCRPQFRRTPRRCRSPHLAFLI